MIGDWAAFFALAGALVFTVGYGFLAPWWRSAIGRNMFMFSVAHMAIFGLVCASVLWGLEWSGRPAVRALVYALIGALFWQRALILITDQVMNRRPPASARKYGATHRVCSSCGK
jgi:hypothetical protein